MSRHLMKCSTKSRSGYPTGYLHFKVQLNSNYSIILRTLFTWWRHWTINPTPPFTKPPFWFWFVHLRHRKRSAIILSGFVVNKFKVWLISGCSISCSFLDYRQLITDGKPFLLIFIAGFCIRHQLMINEHENLQDSPRRIHKLSEIYQWIMLLKFRYLSCR